MKMKKFRIKEIASTVHHKEEIFVPIHGTIVVIVMTSKISEDVIKCIHNDEETCERINYLSQFVI